MNNLAKIMKRKDITPVKLSEITGIAANTIRRIMQDRNVVPQYKTLLKLSEALGYTVAQIKGEKEI
jgi:transcriptional regulator with XRE-family HTH domain